MCLHRAAASIRIRNLLRWTTTNILFLCGRSVRRAWKKIIEKRAGAALAGLPTRMRRRRRRRKRNTELLEQVQPGDLIRYGLDPRIRRAVLPVAGVMNDLDKGALVKITGRNRRTHC